MLNKIKRVATNACIFTGVTLALSAPSFAEGISDLATSADFSEGKTAVAAVAVGLGGFLIFMLVARSVLSFFKRA